MRGNGYESAPRIDPAALRLAQHERLGGTVVTLLCERAERYFSTLLFNPET